MTLLLLCAITCLYTCSATFTIRTESFSLEYTYGSFPVGETVVITENYLGNLEFEFNQSNSTVVLLLNYSGSTLFSKLLEYTERYSISGCIAQLSSASILFEQNDNWFCWCYPPIASISSATFSVLYPLANTPQGVVVVVDSVDRNEWIDATTGAPDIFFKVFNCLLSFSCFVFAVVIFAQQCWSTGKVFLNFASVCIFFVFVASVLRAANILVNPYDFNLTVRVHPLLTLHILFNTISGILLIFFWQDVTHFHMKKTDSKFLSSKYFAGGVTFCVIVTILEISMDILYYFTDNSTNFYMLGFYILSFLCLSIFYFVSALRLLKMINGLTIRDSRKDRIRKVTAKVLVSSAAMFLAPVGGVVMFISLQVIVAGPTLYLCAFWIVYLSLWGQNFSQLMLFSERKKRSSTSASQGTNPSTTSQV